MLTYNICNIHEIFTYTNGKMCVWKEGGGGKGCSLAYTHINAPPRPPAHSPVTPVGVYLLLVSHVPSSPNSL